MGNKAFKWFAAAALLGVAAGPALANNKDRNKRTDANTPCADCCKPLVRPMSESTPARKSDCPKTRRILM